MFCHSIPIAAVFFSHFRYKPYCYSHWDALSWYFHGNPIPMGFPNPVHTSSNAEEGRIMTWMSPGQQSVVEITYLRILNVIICLLHRVTAGLPSYYTTSAADISCSCPFFIPFTSFFFISLLPCSSLPFPFLSLLFPLFPSSSLFFRCLALEVGPP